MSRVAIIGPGALGCLFAGRFFLSGVDTWLLDYNANRASLLETQGIIIEEGGVSTTAHPHVVALQPPNPDLILVLTKSYSTAHLRLPPEVPVLTLQNGLGNAEILAKHCGSRRILAGSTSEAATLMAPGQVRYAARGKTTFGAWDGCATLKALDLLSKAGFKATITENVAETLWWKAVISAAINPLTAVLNVPNGTLLEIPESRAILRGLAEEAVTVARIEGHPFGRNMAETVEHICATTRENISSMLQDIRNGKQTEIEAISGEILRRAATGGLSLPRTQVIYRLVRALERS